MSKRYKCKKTFCVDKYDDDGFLIENDTIVIEEGKIYELDESGQMMVRGWKLQKRHWKNGLICWRWSDERIRENRGRNRKHEK